MRLTLKSASLVAQLVKDLPAVRETQVWSLGWEDPLEKEMATHSSNLPWKSPGQRSLVGCSPRARKESGTTERLTLTYTYLQRLYWLFWDPCSPRDSQDSSPVPQFKSINSSVLSLLHSPTLTSIHDYWENHRMAKSFRENWVFSSFVSASSTALLLFGRSVVSDSLWPHRLQPTRLPCPSLYSELLKHMSIKSVMPSNHLILCHPLLLLTSDFPSIRVFSNESVLHITWPKYWSLSLYISLSSEYSGLIFIEIDRFDLLADQGTVKSLL